MIPLSEINDAAEKFGVPAETIEKDYAIRWVLFCLSQSKIKDDFVFYGGTAIKRIYFDDHRFSEDIDLLSTKKFSSKEKLSETFKEKYGYRPTANILIPCLRNESFKKHWYQRLSKQMAQLPDFDSVIKDIKVKLKNILK